MAGRRRSRSLVQAVLRVLMLVGAMGLLGLGEEAQRAAWADRIVVVTAISDKAGPFDLGLRLGPALGLKNADNAFALSLHLGYAVTPDRNGYVQILPQLHIASGLTQIMLPLGFQFDIPLPRRFYIYPRVAMGYGVILQDLPAGGSQTLHGGVALPAIGVKYVLVGRLALTFEPFDLAVFFNQDTYAVWYRLMFGASLIF